MDKWLIQSVNEDGTYFFQHYQYAWERFLAMIEEQNLTISDKEKQAVRNYIFQGTKLRGVSMFQRLADVCVAEAKEHFKKKRDV